MLIQATGDAWNKCRWDEDGRQNERDSDDRTSDLFHGLLGCLHRRHAFIDVVLNCLDDDDGIVDDQTDGEDEPKERQSIDREAKQWEDDKGSDEGDRHRKQRDQRRTPTLQEDEDHNHDEPESFEQRDDNLMDTGRDGRGGIERDVVADARREGRRELLHSDPYSRCGRNGIRTR